MFNFTQKLRFPSNNDGEIAGIADSGVETFKGHPMKSLAREIDQNSLDADLQNGQPTRIEFKAFEIAPSAIPGYKDLKDAFERALDYWTRQENNKAIKFFAAGLREMQKERILCLRISDFNTTGLTGSRKEGNSSWNNLIKSSGASAKSGSHGGSFGIGKFAPFACSLLRTVFYSTIDCEDVCAHQGVARLASFKNKKGEMTQGVGYYGNERNSPAYEPYSLDPNYVRDTTDSGTDIFITGFTGDENWKYQLAASVLDGFLYAIYMGKLVVDVEDIHIDKDALPELMISLKDYFQEYADEYYQTLVDEKLAKSFEKEYVDDEEIAGKISLRLMIKPNYHRRVAMVRQTGMKIKDKNGINGLIPFAGMLHIEGNSLNSFLRNLENPQHLDWELSRAEEKKSKAEKLLRSFTRFIKECLKEMQNDDSEEILDPSVGEFLSAAERCEQENEEKAEGIKDTIKNIEFRENKVMSKPNATAQGEGEPQEVEDENGDLFEDDLPGEEGSSSKNGGSNGGGNGGGGEPGSGSGGETPTPHRKSLVLVEPKNIRSLVRSKKDGAYTIVFTPGITAEDGYMDIYMSAESQKYEAALLAATCNPAEPLICLKNRVSGLSFVKDVPLKINIEMDYQDYCSLEVKAYGNKV